MATATMNAVRMIQSRFCNRGIHAPEEEAESCRNFIPAASSNVVTITPKSREQAENTRHSKTRSPLRWIVRHCTHNRLFPVALGVARGPARVLERLSQTFTRLVPYRIVPSDVRAGKDQLPPAQQRDRQSHPLQGTGSSQARTERVAPLPRA